MPRRRIKTVFKSVTSRLQTSKSQAASISLPQASVQKSLSPEERKRRAVSGAAGAGELGAGGGAMTALDRDLLNQMRQVSLADKEAHTRLIDWTADECSRAASPVDDDPGRCERRAPDTATRKAD
jgi:hypothetical protein